MIPGLDGLRAIANNKVERSSTWERISIGFLFLLGIVLRLRQYLTGRSLWVDEAMLALNIVHRNFAGLLQQPMEYGQSAPIGYVFSVKVFTLLLGDSEYALRFFSVLAGCIAFVLMVVIAKRYLNATEAIIAIALFACAPYLIYYTSEAKQYIGDVLVCLSFLFFFFWMIERQARLQDFFALGVAGTVLLWFSHPSVFVAAGVGISLFLHYWMLRDKRRLLWTAVCGTAWSIDLAILYLVNLRYLAASDLLLNYWQGGFMQKSMNWFVEIWRLLLNDPLSLQVNPLIALMIFIAGIVFLFRRSWRFGTVILLPLLLVLIASAFHKYSLLGRMLLFALPIFIIVLASGVAGLASLIRNQYASAGLLALLTLYLIWSPLRVSFEEFVQPKMREHIKPTMQYLQEYGKPDDVIYVYYNAGPAFRYYAARYDLSIDNTIIGLDHSADPKAYYPELDQLDGKKRVWLLFSHVYERDQFNEKDFILNYVNRLGKKVREYRVPGASVYLYLYDLR